MKTFHDIVDINFSLTSHTLVLTCCLSLVRVIMTGNKVPIKSLDLKQNIW